MAWFQASASSVGPACLGPHCSLLTPHPHPCSRKVLCEMGGGSIKWLRAWDIVAPMHCIHVLAKVQILHEVCCSESVIEVQIDGRKCWQPVVPAANTEWLLGLRRWPPGSAALHACSGLGMFPYYGQCETEALEHHLVHSKSPFPFKGSIVST